MFEIELYLEANPSTGEVFLSPLDVMLSHWDVVEPDLLFVAGDQPDILTEKNIQGPPALVVEVLSKSTRKRDAQVKRRLFELTAEDGDVLTTPLLPGCQIDLRELFRGSP